MNDIINLYTRDLKDETLIRNESIAAILGIKISALARWKERKKFKLKPVKQGRHRLYRYKDVVDFMRWKGLIRPRIVNHNHKSSKNEHFSSFPKH